MKNRITPTLLVALVAVLSIPTAVIASHRFTDVPASNIFHDDISWLADVGVTRGCNPPSNTQFCPSSPVTREQMAAFMRRLAEGEFVAAGSAVRADLADDADLLDGSPAEAYLATGFGVGPRFTDRLANSDAMTLLSATVSNVPARSQWATANMDVTFTLDHGETTADHWFVCWISTFEAASWNPTPLDDDGAPQRWLSYPAGSAAVSGFHDVSLSVSRAVPLAEGESVTLYLQCADQFAGDAPTDERFYFSANGYITAVPTSETLFLASDSPPGWHEGSGPPRP